MGNRDAKTTVKFAIRAAITNYGGDTIVAGDRMENMVNDIYNEITSGTFRSALVEVLKELDKKE